MLEYNEITKRKYIVYEDEPYEVLESHVFRKQQRKPVNQTKLKHLITGRVIEHSFGQSEKAEEADIEKKKYQFQFKKKDEYFFAKEGKPSERITLSLSQLGSATNFIKENDLIDILFFDDNQIIGVTIPIKVQLKVVEAPPNVKGNTAQGGNKKVVLETGYIVDTPMFIQEGDIVEVNTETGEYTTRV